MLQTKSSRKWRGISSWTVPLESDSAGLRAGKPEVFLQTPADERAPFLFSRRAMDGLLFR